MINQKEKIHPHTRSFSGNFGVGASQKGSLMIYLIIAIFVFIIVMTPVTIIFSAKLQLLRLTVERESAFQIAEAGIDYYQWHLIEFPSDYQDGTGAPPPMGGYVHTYTDYDTQQAIGQFSLTITAPTQGETATTIQSTGWTNDNPSMKRIVTAIYRRPFACQLRAFNS